MNYTPKRPDVGGSAPPVAQQHARRERRRHRWLALLVPAVVVLGVSFGNRVHPYIGGLPLLFAWVAGLVVLTSVVMALINRLDHAADATDRVGSDHDQ